MENRVAIAIFMMALALVLAMLVYVYFKAQEVKQVRISAQKLLERSSQFVHVDDLSDYVQRSDFTQQWLQEHDQNSQTLYELQQDFKDFRDKHKSLSLPPGLVAEKGAVVGGKGSVVGGKGSKSSTDSLRSAAKNKSNVSGAVVGSNRVNGDRIDASRMENGERIDSNRMANGERIGSSLNGAGSKRMVNGERLGSSLNATLDSNKTFVKNAAVKENDNDEEKQRRFEQFLSAEKNNNDSSVDNSTGNDSNGNNSSLDNSNDNDSSLSKDDKSQKANNPDFFSDINVNTPQVEFQTSRTHLRNNDSDIDSPSISPKRTDWNFNFAQDVEK